MQIVIEIPDDFYKKVQDDYRLGNGDAVQIPMECIANGTPLPDNHGRLIDVDELLINERPSGMSMIQWEDTHFYKTISDAPTVVESTKGNR